MKSYISQRQVKDQAEAAEAANEFWNNVTIKKCKKYIDKIYEVKNQFISLKFQFIYYIWLPLFKIIEVIISKTGDWSNY